MIQSFVMEYRGAGCIPGRCQTKKMIDRRLRFTSFVPGRGADEFIANDVRADKTQ
ncbi:hypothetical protein BRYFOR_06851 [Marvinbryantia formatexigens DSM 14469]|uniref:Uncharacterized protein n=1 Tax=Marvinbryantia formatexigens DSM 14469 TaxID=478749 RepID=C6LE02_9FIRM|nr:hypothetical protein [Marvinbryantia formatexigens]EET61206.1 hypothetical protein BRYFOR_06851 [Marvinbryantia formatexigens DSM 14469]